MRIGDAPLVSTIKEKCRMCYTCVRECPAKAIQVAYGQASIVAQRCIGCGNCIRVCGQKAKKVYSSIEGAELLLRGGRPTVAIVAPSWPAEFSELDDEAFAGTLRALGFAGVHEVSFGADLVAKEYSRLLSETDGRYIATTCPAVVSYIEKYVPDLLPAMIPVVSPMIATARVVRRLRGGDVSVVFVGPCIAKKGEAVDEEVAGEVHAALTFGELRQMIVEHAVDSSRVERGAFDPPHGGLGGLFPVSRGLLQAARMEEDLLRGDLMVVDGKVNFWAAIREFRKDPGDVRLMEVLSCHGCIMGPGFSREEPILERRHRVTQAVKKGQAVLDKARYAEDLRLHGDISLRRGFTAFDQRIERPSDTEMACILALMGKTKPEDELNCGACGYATCRKHATAVYRGLAEVEMCLPYAIEHLRTTVQALERSHQDLSAAKEALTQSEKLASMGQVAAGIAHEVNNPLGVVLLYTNLLLEKCSERVDMKEDLSLIVEHAERCKKIVAGLLNFARQNKVFRQPTDVGRLLEKAVGSVQVPESIRVVLRTDAEDPSADLDPDQMMQVLTNMISNAVAAMPGGGTLTLRAAGDAANVELAVADTGVGIPKENMKKVFEPFFTTKQVGKGTGLGLAMCHGIVKMHCGQIRADSNANPAAGPTGTTFTITLPRREP
ncbi:MAG: [Fe-Fe] hydrogenase large subunit C-terminal domain-containing protein [Elusimicrobiota bacterium]|jgi:signal transduction histidine kinase/Fe-S-cluster-containing hydrogenase component 2